MNILLVSPIDMRVSTFGFVCLQTVLFTTPYESLLYLPAYVTVAKLIPDDVEASIFAILKAI
jgi:hypothetical protein